MKLDGNTASLLAGGVGGMIGSVTTCPLEVVKVRLQSTVATFTPQTTLYLDTSTSSGVSSTLSRPKISIWNCVRFIAQTEGWTGLFKGVGPTLVGVLPARGVYFWGYHKGQEMFKDILPKQTSANYMAASIFGGFCSSTATNPIWYIKTRLQLDQQAGKKTLTVGQCIRNTLKERGVMGFYRGIQASYVGISETALHFVIYENLKREMLSRGGTRSLNDSRITGLSDVAYCMIASTVSKSFATTVCYPHEVVRTLLRQEGSKYRGFVQTLKLVVQEDGWKGLYRGLAAHYIRQIPNTCILMASYEAVVYLLQRYDLVESADQ